MCTVDGSRTLEQEVSVKGPPPSDALHATNPQAAGAVVWLTGLPASGKSTLAKTAAKRLRRAGIACCLLDGDAVRAAFEPAPGYGEGDRANYYVTLGNLAALLAAQGMVVVVPATAHLRVFRKHARNVATRFVEVHVALPAHHCASRDTKGLYQAAEAGAIGQLPGVGVTYEPPLEPDVVASGGKDTQALRQLVELVQSLVALPTRRGKS